MGVVDAKDCEQLSPFFKGKTGHAIANFLLRITSVEKINKLYDGLINYSGPDFAFHILEKLGVDYYVGNAERLKLLPEGPFITISNHPYGGLDGVMIIDLIGHVRSDFKVMVNNLLSLIKTLNVSFIPVTPKFDDSSNVSGTNLYGIRYTLEHLKNGHPAGFFPAGAVSNFYLKDFRVKDRPWQTSVLRLIRSARVPVLPVRFFDGNSPFFYFLGLISWKIRVVKLPSEVFNKKRQKQRIGIGNIISVEEQKKYTDIQSFGEFLRNSVYEMPLPATFIPRSKLSFANSPHIEKVQVN
jgi:putative hemolysin